MAKKKKARRRKKALGPTSPPVLPTPGPAHPKNAIKKVWILPAAVVIIAVVGLFFILTSRGKNVVRRDPGLNILLITLDTTRADRLGCYGYTKGKTPNLDSLAAKGVRFENAYCQVPLTLPSHCSIMTGTNPVYHNVHNNGTYTLAPQQVTLAEVLKDSGFKTAAFVASFSVDSRFGLNQGFDVYDDDFQPGLPFKTPNSERRAGQVVAVFTSWLEKNSGEHFFVWVHLFDPHLPYQPPPPYREQFADSPYDGEIAYMDSQIGALVEKLKEKKILDRTLIVLAGDHGEAFGEKVETGHGVFLYDGTMKVPLIFYGENHLPAAKVVRGRVRLIDIMPSILDLLGLPKMAQTQGKSLIPYFTGKENKDLESYIETFYPRENYGWSELTGLIRGDWKYIRAPRPELFNLKSDPKENENVFGSTPKIASEMASGLETLIKASAGIHGASNRTLTAAEEERLRALGYTSFSGGGTKSSYPDPKDKLDILRLTQQAGAYEFEKNYDQAEAVYEKILALVPDSPASYVNLALSQARSNKYEESIQTLKRGMERIPESQILLSRLAHTCLEAGRLREALDAAADILRANSAHPDALAISALAMDTLGEKIEARTYYERAIALEPKNKYLRMRYARNLASSGLTAQAVDVYTGLVKDYPGDNTLYQDLGVAYGVMGNYAKSIETLKQAVAIRPTPIAYFNLAVACNETGELAEAIRFLKLYLADPQGESERDIKIARDELQNLERTLKEKSAPK